MKKIIKTCPKHGDLTFEEVRVEPAPRNTKLGGVTYRCSYCRKERNDKSRVIHKESRKLAVKKYDDKNREKLNEWARQDRANNPEKYKRLRKNRRMKVGSRVINNEILRKYGLSVEQYEKMCNDQNDLCAICNKPETRKSRTKGEVTKLTIDHCHTTMAIRGLLCAECNAGLGKFCDNAHLLSKAIVYLSQLNHRYLMNAVDYLSKTMYEKDDEFLKEIKDRHKIEAKEGITLEN